MYHQPAQAEVVRRCFDERPCQRLGQVLTPSPAKPNATQKEHPEYLRNGVCNVLLERFFKSVYMISAVAKPVLGVLCGYPGSGGANGLLRQVAGAGLGRA